MTATGDGAAEERVLGVDLGTVRVGLALATGGVAVPVDTLDVADAGAAATDDAWAEAIAARIDRAATDRACDRIVVGLPRGMSGRDTRATQRARRVATALERYGRRVVLFDERLTSVEADRALQAAGRSGRQRRRELDRAAATVILQGWLDARGG
jgi:putative holliday junction resolvase